MARAARKRKPARKKSSTSTTFMFDAQEVEWQKLADDAGLDARTVAVCKTMHDHHMRVLLALLQQRFRLAS